MCNPVLCKLRSDNSEGKKRYKTDNNKGKHFQHRALASQTVAQKVELLCEGCNRPNHTLERCWNFSSKSSDEKRELIRTKGICFSCLKNVIYPGIVQLNLFVQSVNNNIQPACMKTYVGIWKFSRIESVKTTPRVPDATETNRSMKVWTHPASGMTVFLCYCIQLRQNTLC